MSSPLHRYSAWKTGAVSVSDYKTLHQDLKDLSSATCQLEAMRAEVIAERASIMYAAYGFTPRVIVIPTPNTKDLGIEIEKSKGGVGYSISHIADGSIAASSGARVNDIIVELNSTFLLDASWEQVRLAFAAGSVESVFVLVRTSSKTPPVPDTKASTDSSTESNTDSAPSPEWTHHRDSSSRSESASGGEEMHGDTGGEDMHGDTTGGDESDEHEEVSESPPQAPSPCKTTTTTPAAPEAKGSSWVASVTKLLPVKLWPFSSHK